MLSIDKIIRFLILLLFLPLFIKAQSNQNMDSSQLAQYMVNSDSMPQLNRFTHDINLQMINSILSLNKRGSAITADNGLTANTSTNVRLGGSLVTNTTITDGGFTITFSNNTATTSLVGNNSSSGTGVEGISSSGIGISGASTSYIGVQGQSSSSYGVWGISTTGIGGVFNINPSSTNSDAEVLRLYRTTSGTASANIGAFQSYYIETSDGTSQEAVRAIARWTDATTGTRTSKYILAGVNSTTTQDLFTLAGNGLTTLNKYGNHTFLVTDSGRYKPAVIDTTDGSLHEGYWFGGGGTTYTFSTGLTNSGGTITNDLSTGISGGQTLIGGTAASNSLTISSTSNATKGRVIFGTTSGMVWNENLNSLGLGMSPPNTAILYVNTGSTAITASLADLSAGQFSFGNISSSSAAPTIQSKSTIGFRLNTGSPNTNTDGDFTFNIRADNNADYSTLTNDGFIFSRYATTIMTLRRDGTLKILKQAYIGGITVPTALLQLAAGTATASTAPLKFTSGTNLTTAEAGAMEYNGTNLFFTRTGTTRESIITANAVNSVSPTSPNRTITVIIDGTTYYLAAKTTND